MTQVALQDTRPPFRGAPKPCPDTGGPFFDAPSCSHPAVFFDWISILPTQCQSLTLLLALQDKTAPPLTCPRPRWCHVWKYLGKKSKYSKKYFFAHCDLPVYPDVFLDLTMMTPSLLFIY
jgi:hypothetical protein